MKNKLTIGLITFALAALFPLSSLSKTEPSAPEAVTLSDENLILLTSEVNGESVSQIIVKARALDDKLSGLKEKVSGTKKPLYLFLSTPGGSIQSGLELIEALKGIGRPVHTITLFAASMGFQIVQNLDDRLILKNGVLMSHHATGEFAGAFGGVSPNQADNRYQLWLDRVRELDEQTVKRTKGKQTYESYIKEYDHEMWPTGTRSVKEGYADKIVTVKCDKSLSGVTTKSVNFFGFEISFDLDNCPINTSPMNIRVKAPGAPGEKFNTQLEADVIARFQDMYKNKQKQVIPLYW